MAGTIVVDRIESDASYASTINVANRITFSNTVNFGVFAGTAPVAGFYLPTTNNLAFTTASTERMRIDNQGNVGIGTTAPLTKLDVIGPAGITNFGSTSRLGFLIQGATSTNDYTGIDFTQNGNIARARIGAYFSGGGSYLSIGTSNNYTTGITNYGVTIDPNGYVGVGVQLPIRSLHVNGELSVTSSGTSYINISDSAGNNGTARSLVIRGLGTNGSAGNTLASVSIDASTLYFTGAGTATQAFVARAWVNYSATAGSTSIRGSGNISSITYNAVGDHTLNFASAMPDTNYALIGYSGQASGDARHIGAITSQSTSAIRYLVQYISNTGGGGTAINNTNNHIAIFR